jgi:hypothetical protein
LAEKSHYYPTPCAALWREREGGVLGLKQKFSFSYFQENFAKIYFRFSQKKAYEKLQKIMKIFEKIFAKLSRKRKCKRKRRQETGNIVKYLKISNPDGASKQIGQQ